MLADYQPMVEPGTGGYAGDDTEIMGRCEAGHLHGYTLNEITWTGGQKGDSPCGPPGGGTPQEGYAEGRVECAEPGCREVIEILLS